MEKARAPIYQEGRGEEAIQVGEENPSDEVSNTLKYVQAGRLQQFVQAWKDITDYPELLEWVEHCHLEIMEVSVPLMQETDYKVIQFNEAESSIVDSEIVKLPYEGVIVESTHSHREFFWTIFLRR